MAAEILPFSLEIAEFIWRALGLSLQLRLDMFPYPSLCRWPSGQISEGAVSSFWMPPVCPGKLQKGSKLGEI